MKKNNILNKILEKVDLEEQISLVESVPEKYNAIVDEFGVTDDLNKIIDSFEQNLEEASNLYKKSDTKIGIISDEFMFYALKDAANFVYIPFQENIEIDKSLDVLLVVSSWRGLDHSWDYVANPKGRVRAKLIELIGKYKESNIPTVFYSKEDPVSYKEYLSIAKETDFIFTSAAECVDDYKRDTNNENVYPLEFGVNPLYHNPIGKNLTDKKLNKIVTFAGSWMVRFPQRNEVALEIFKGVAKTDYELSIIDRQYERKMPRYHYPYYLISNIAATIPHERLMKLHKATSWGINLNSVQDSETMFANRIYELQAMGNIIISNYNKGVHQLFPHVFISHNRNEVENLLTTLSIKDKKRLIAKGISEVMLHHTSFHRVYKLLNSIGIEHELSLPSVLVVGNGDITLESFKRQSYKNIEFISLEDFNEKKDVMENFDYISFFAKTISYEEYYIENLVSTLAYTNADAISMNLNSYKYVEQTNFIKSSGLIKVDKYEDVFSKSDSAKYFNIPKTEISSVDKTEEANIERKILTIIIPVQDDYKYLEDKSLFSLSRLKNFEKISVILVDENKYETNKYKDNTLKRVCNKFNNVKVFDQNDEVSISNFNELVENVNTPYIMFINPESQLVVNNFDTLLNCLDTYKSDIIAGLTNRMYINNDSKMLYEDIYTNLLHSRITKESIVIRTEYLKEKIDYINDNNEIDTVYKLISEAKNVIELSQFINNEMNDNYIALSTKPLEKLSMYYQKELKLKEYVDGTKLTEYYTNNVFVDNFYKNYMDLFKKVTSNEKAEALVILKNIFNLFEKDYDGGNTKVNQFVELLFK